VLPRCALMCSFVVMLFSSEVRDGLGFNVTREIRWCFSNR
jgi:hypothetical protein